MVCAEEKKAAIPYEDQAAEDARETSYTIELIVPPIFAGSERLCVALLKFIRVGGVRPVSPSSPCPERDTRNSLASTLTSESRRLNSSDPQGILALLEISGILRLAQPSSLPCIRSLSVRLHGRILPPPQNLLYWVILG